MRNKLFVLGLLALLTIMLPITASALGLDVEAKGGAGLALGTTNNSSITGTAVRLAADGGVGIDLYLLTVGSAELGLSIGAEYSYLTFHSTWANKIPVGAPGGASDLTTDSTYNYLNIPISLVGSVPINPSLKLVVRAGGFIGYFLSGTANNTFSNPNYQSQNGSVALDSNSTNQWEYGLHFTAGADFGVGGGFSVEPALQFDMGLTDTTPNNAQNGSFNDTFWSLILTVAIKYSVL